MVEFLKWTHTRPNMHLCTHSQHCSCFRKTKQVRQMHAGGEDDYMGDLSLFLQPVETEERRGYRGKLNGKDQRTLSRKEQQKLEDERLRDGFGSAIPSTNIGYKMLQQMGYNPGGALGKHGQGRLEPLNVEIKRHRTGLGRDRVVEGEKIRKRKERDRIIEKNMRKQQIMVSDFGERQKALWQSRKIRDNYKKASAALIQLEAANGDTEKEKRVEEEMEETEEDEGEVTAEELQEILDRLRTEFCYCLYCGCQYESANAMLSHCPGPEEDDH